MSRAWILVVAAALACARPGPSEAPEPAPTLEQLFVAERHAELVRAAEAALADEDLPRERVAEARFYRAIAWLAGAPGNARARGLAELRALEFEYPDLIWGRLAELEVAAAGRVEALQATLVELALAQHEAHAELEALARRLAEREAALARTKAEADKLERERADLRAQLEQARARLVEQSAALAELEAELAALKQIDMQREP